MQEPRRVNKRSGPSAFARSHHGAARWALALLGVALFVLTTASSVHADADAEAEAEEAEVDTEVAEELTGVAALVELPGSCGAGAPLEPGWSVDCSFVVRPDVDVSLFDFATISDEGGEFGRCYLEPSAAGSSLLECPDLLRDRFEQGTFSFDLQLGAGFEDDAAEVTTRWNDDQRFSLYANGNGESVVFDGRPLRWFAYLYDPLDGLFVTIRERNGEEIVATLPVPLEDVFTSFDGVVTPELPIGRYRLWPCVGDSPKTCVEEPGGRPFQVVDGEPVELIDGHNRRTADRINILFVGSGLERAVDVETPLDLATLATQLLTIGGPLGLDRDGNPLSADEPASELVWGPMATEPLASNGDRFNFWYLDDDVADEQGLLFGGDEEYGDDGFGLSNLQITALYASDSRFSSDARVTSFESVEPTELPARGRMRFGDARVWIPTNYPLPSARTLTHEWGHGLFGLRDEYYGFDDRGVTAGFPNCAPDEETGLLWWGDLLGEVDPFAAEVVAVERDRLAEQRFDNTDDLIARTATAVTAGGCYSDFESTEVYRPSEDSMMNSEIPVFGVVNRQRVQAVLDQFSGRGPMGSLEDLSLECEGLLGRVTCRGELLTHLDKPLSTVAVDSMPCEFGRGRPLPEFATGPVPVTCTTIGPPAEPVELTFKGEVRELQVLDMNPPPIPVPMESRIIPSDAVSTGGQDGSNMPNRTVWIGALLIVAAVSLALVERHRRAAAVQ